MKNILSLTHIQMNGKSRVYCMTFCFFNWLHYGDRWDERWSRQSPQKTGEAQIDCCSWWDANFLWRFTQVTKVRVSKLALISECDWLRKTFPAKKNPAYGRHWISRPMRIIGPIFFFGGGWSKKNVTHDMWHVTCDTWHVTRDTCHLSHVTSHLSLQEQPQPQTLPFVTCPVGAQ